MRREEQLRYHSAKADQKLRQHMQKSLNNFALGAYGDAEPAGPASTDASIAGKNSVMPLLLGAGALYLLFRKAKR